jgi:SAM-dependent methyltransferase
VPPPATVPPLATIASVTEIEPAARRAFLDARRTSARERFDADLAPSYDASWGDIAPSHVRFIGRLLDLVSEGGLVLDVPCGTGKHWPQVLESGRHVIGLDQSAGMLEAARTKHPQVPAALGGLQELAYRDAFDGVMCIEGLEYLGPEDWSSVLEGLRRAARPGAPLYLTVEQADPGHLAAALVTARDAGYPVVPGEDFDPEGGGYHFHPGTDRVHAWAEDAGLAIIEEAEADDYLHLLLRRRA